MRGYEAVVQALIEGGADVNTKDEVTEARLLHALVAGSCVELTKPMLKDGAEIELKTDDGNTPLHIAAILNRLPVAQLLMERKPILRLGTIMGTRHSNMQSGMAMKN